MCVWLKDLESLAVEALHSLDVRNSILRHTLLLFAPPIQSGGPQSVTFRSNPQLEPETHEMSCVLNICEYTAVRPSFTTGCTVSLWELQTTQARHSDDGQATDAQKRRRHHPRIPAV